MVRAASCPDASRDKFMGRNCRKGTLVPSLVSMKQLLEAGVHFGHQTRRWDPRMRRFIFTERNGIHIIDLQQTVTRLSDAYDFVRDLAANGGTLLFVGTKKQAQEAVEAEATRCRMPYVNNRWLGGTLTNFRTMKLGLDRLRALERMREDGTYEQLLKKETVQLDKERARLEKYIGGMKGMPAVPQALFIIDTAQETIAVREARKLGIPIVAIADTTSTSLTSRSGTLTLDSANTIAASTAPRMVPANSSVSSWCLKWLAICVHSLARRALLAAWLA